MREAEEHRYFFEVYHPGSSSNVWVLFESDYPFLSVHAGDILNPGIWPDSQSPVRVLRVVNVEHIVWESPKTQMVKHKVMVFTEEVDGRSATLRTERMKS